MSQFSRSTLISVAAVVIVVVGGYWWWLGKQPVLVPLVAPNNESAAPQTENPPPPAPAPDTSDASLNQDLSNVDSQMNGLSSDTQSVDQGLNDQPIPQGQ